MTETDAAFRHARNQAFDTIITRVDERIAALPASLHDIKANAEKDIWSLFRQGVSHLKDGAPKGQPGSLAEALARTSLRSAPLAAALGVKPPQFEPLYFGADYASGREAALFLCTKLAEAAEGDFPKSRQTIQQKILMEKPAADIKEHMAIAFGALTEAYPRICSDVKTLLKA